MIPDKLENFYLDHKEPNKSCLLALRSIILEFNADLSETIKYGMPCFCYKKKMFCYLWVDKKSKEPYILMVDGKFLKHPNLEKGDRERMSIFRVNPHSDIPIDSINILLDEAIKLRDSGNDKIKWKKR